MFEENKLECVPEVVKEWDLCGWEGAVSDVEMMQEEFAFGLVQEQQQLKAQKQKANDDQMKGAGNSAKQSYNQPPQFGKPMDEADFE